MIRLAIFDMDDVLYAYDREARVDHIVSATGLAPDRVREALWGGDFENRAEAGEWPTGAAYLEAFNRRLGFDLPRADWVAARRASMRPDTATIALAEALKASVAVGLLTNNASLLREEIAVIAPEIVPVFAPRLHASVDFGARKPDPAVFLRYLDRYGIAPQEALFVDDGADNVAGAENLGMAGHVFAGAEGLRGWLASLSLLPDER